MKVASSRTGRKEVSYWKWPCQSSLKQNQMRITERSYTWLLGGGLCAILHCCKKACMSIRAPLCCSNSSRQGSAASPLPVCRNGEWGKNTFRKSSPTLPAMGRRRGEKKRERKKTQGGVRACLCVRLSGGEKMPVVPCVSHKPFPMVGSTRSRQ